ncbi:RNA pseudouridine synthase, partial [Pelagibacteraceae bacterium]|nr:RNA pseudouridine synthase [Pelagibacteraceae bacterium]
MKNFFLIDENFADTRIDRWFKKEICNVPQSLIEKNIRKGHIKVNEKKIKCSYKLQLNDKVKLDNINFLPNIGKKKLSN